VGDVHIKAAYFDRVDILERTLLDTVHTHSLDTVCLLGDILHYHEKIHTLELNRACTLIERLSEHVRVIILVGNHDLINNSQFLSTHHWMNPLKVWDNVVIVDTPRWIDGCVFVPYVAPSRFEEALNTLQKEWTQCAYIFAHQEFKGAKMGAITSTTGDDWDAAFPLVISGHVHTRQQPQPNIMYIGASIPTAFSDTSQPVLLRVDTCAQTIEEEPIPLMMKKTVYRALEDEHVLDLPDDLCTSNTRLVIKGDWEHFKMLQKQPRFKELEQKGVKIVGHPSGTPGETPVETVEHHVSEFETVLRNNVLRERNNALYALFEDVVYNQQLDINDFLIV
jgi:DNA repair exonuclease SbcCD nuclease subunit